MNDLSRPYPTLALAQRLWDDPLAVAATTVEPLLRAGLLRRGEGADAQPDWQQPLEMPAPVAAVLAGLVEPTDAGGLHRIPAAEPPAEGERALLAWRLAARPPAALEVVPLNGPAGGDFAASAASLAAPGGRPLLRAPSALLAGLDGLPLATTLAWLAGADLLLPEGMLAGGRRLDGVLARCLALPVRWYLPMGSRAELEGLPAAVLLPEATVPTLSYAERLALLVEGLGSAGERLRPTAEECARRFRFQAPALRRVVASVRGRPGLDGDTLLDACRMEAGHHLGQLAQRVEPRFTSAELILPEAQARQFREVSRAMESLTRVHYQWGTARAWNEGGLSVLFCGPPGTGKTMGAEALAAELRLDLYRVDLSQVVNKYIGETEKNLRRIFDAAEASDCILFFDEADALFGKRTDVKDAHDRFANIEISYLLERMERFKGLAILATNRRKDLDEAFLRRLRTIIEFPLPGPAERETIWRNVIPAAVDAEDLDFRFLARHFSLAGGHIRSIVFNACLQAAHRPPEKPLPPGKQGRLTMAGVLVQVQRELQKLNRAAGPEQFGPYAAALAEEPA